MSFEPRESLPKSCTHCDENRASTESPQGLCPMCWMAWRVAQEDVVDAYAVADLCGYPHSTVRRMIRDNAERGMRAEARKAAQSCCKRCNLPILTGDGGEKQPA